MAVELLEMGDIALTCGAVTTVDDAKPGVKIPLVRTCGDVCRGRCDCGSPEAIRRGEPRSPD